MSGNKELKQTSFNNTWWKLYTVFLVATFVFSVIDAPGHISAGVPVWQLVFWTLAGLPAPVFMLSRLWDKEWFNRTFWKVVFVAEIVTFPFGIQFGNTLIEANEVETTLGSMVFAVIVVSVSMLPYLFALYKYSFRDSR